MRLPPGQNSVRSRNSAGEPRFSLARSLLTAVTRLAVRVKGKTGRRWARRALSGPCCRAEEGWRCAALAPRATDALLPEDIGVPFAIVQLPLQGHDASVSGAGASRWEETWSLYGANTSRARTHTINFTSRLMLVICHFSCASSFWARGSGEGGQRRRSSCAALGHLLTLSAHLLARGLFEYSLWQCPLQSKCSPSPTSAPSLSCAGLFSKVLATGESPLPSASGHVP